MIKTDVYEDIEIAKQMLQNKDKINSNIYHNKYQFSNNSSIYRFSNEYIEKKHL